MSIFQNLKSSLIIPDTHRPFHNRKAYKLMTMVAKDLDPYEIVLLGDYGDFYFANLHGAKSPRVRDLAKEERDSVNEGLDELDSLFPKAQKVFIEGNHEYRLERFLIEKAPELFDIINVKTLFNMHKRSNWKWIDYGPDQSHRILGSKLIARHEPSGNSAKQSASKSLCNLVYGHIHRLEESHIVGLDGNNHVNFSVGWLGQKRNDVMRYVKGHWQWQLGFGIVYVDTKTKNFYHQKIHIIEENNNYSCVFNGKKYSI